MNKHLKRQFIQEVAEGRVLYLSKDYNGALYYFERAHVLGQRYVYPHVLVHWWMLKTSIRQLSIKDFFVQGAFIVLGFLGSLVGIVAKPNYGRVGKTINVRPISYDIMKFLHEDEK